MEYIVNIWIIIWLMAIDLMNSSVGELVFDRL